MPLTLPGFIPAAILIMAGSLAIRQLYNYWKHNHQKL